MIKAFTKITGHLQLQRLLKTMPPKVVRKGMKKAMTKSSTPILKAARQRAPVRTGALKLSLDKKIKGYRKDGVWIAVIGAKTSVESSLKGKTIRPFKYAHLVNDGTKFARAKPFLGVAFEIKKAEAIRIAKDVLRETLAAEAKKK